MASVNKATLTPKEISWLIMTPGFYFHTPKETPSRIKRVPFDEGENKRAVNLLDVAGIKYRSQRLNKIATILMHGFSRKETYDTLVLHGELTYEGSTLTRGSFRTLCVDISKNHNIPVQETKKAIATRLFANGLSIEEIMAEMKITKKQPQSLKTALRNDQKEPRHGLSQ